jgi:ubiquinone/menaquinone biosynthesis C-methylase UbiE
VTSETDGVLTDVQDKYLTRNPISRRLVSGFFDTAHELLARVGPSRVLDMGCGEGYAANRIRPWLNPSAMVGMDLSRSLLAEARRNYPSISLVCATAYRMPWPDESFDLVLAMEVLEHLIHPEDALGEVRRLTTGHVLASVPREPAWRILNMARGAYWKGFGNTPGHLQHWSKQSFVRTLSRYFHVDEVRSPFPWTMVLCSV